MGGLLRQKRGRVSDRWPFRLALPDRRLRENKLAWWRERVKHGFSNAFGAGVRDWKIEKGKVKMGKTDLWEVVDRKNRVLGLGCGGEMCGEKGKVRMVQSSRLGRDDLLIMQDLGVVLIFWVCD